MQERSGIVTLKGNRVTLLGEAPKVGQAAPDCQLVANDLSPVSLSAFRGKVCILASVPSLDTPVCDSETRRFNQEAASLGEDAVVIAVSVDLPFAQKRWCGAAGVDRVITLSDHRDVSFGLGFGVLIKELRLLARAVFILDREGVLRYSQIVPEATDEPDYEGVLTALKSLI
ncbi:MAG: thiol peroxidase [Desulfuromonadaceae bacterium]|nr:thiol peroxidase [Desulfuromonadaceae bacterium]